MWKMSFIKVISDVCSGVSVYHVALIVLLRCITIAKPLTFDKWHQRLDKISIYGIWIFNTAIFLTPTIICLVIHFQQGFTASAFSDNELKWYAGAWNVVRHINYTIPIGLIIIFYLYQLYHVTSCRGNDGKRSSMMDNKKSMEKMIHMVAIGTLVCYVPYATWIQYNIYMIGQKRTCEVLDNTVKVSRLPVIDLLCFVTLYYYNSLSTV